MGEERPWRGPRLSWYDWMAGDPPQTALGGGRLQDFSCLPKLLAWGCHLWGRAGPQSPPRLAPTPSSPTRLTQRVRPCPAPPEYRSTAPPGTPKHTPQCPHFQSKDCHAAPTIAMELQSPSGVPRIGKRTISVPFPIPWGVLACHPNFTQPWEGNSFRSIKPGVWGQVGPKLEPHRTLPCPSHTPNLHQCHPCPASQVTLGGQGGLEVPLSEMEKCY